MSIFISYSKKDEAIYSTITLALDGAGVQRWDVESLKAGDSLAEQLRSAIEKCEVCVFLATKSSIKSQWCLAEIGAFWGAGKKVIVYMADSGLNESHLPPQFQGNLRARNGQELLKAIREADKPAQTYDVFLAVPMAAYANEDEYQTARIEVLKVIEAFREYCKFTVYCAVEQCKTMKSFQTTDVSAKLDLKAIRNSRNFVMIYPRKISSSILVEAGFALAFRKYSVYFTTERKELPYMLQDLPNYFPDVCVHELDCASNYDCIVDGIRNNKTDLFQSEHYE